MLVVVPEAWKVDALALRPGETCRHIAPVALSYVAPAPDAAQPSAPVSAVLLYRYISTTLPGKNTVPLFLTKSLEPSAIESNEVPAGSSPSTAAESLLVPYRIMF